MSGIADLIENLENKLQKVILKNQLLEQANHNLQEKLEIVNQTITKQKLELESLQMQQTSLKIANSLLGSEENKRDTKLKINSLVRDIDYCIAQLSE